MLSLYLVRYRITIMSFKPISFLYSPVPMTPTSQSSTIERRDKGQLHQSLQLFAQLSKTRLENEDREYYYLQWLVNLDFFLTVFNYKYLIDDNETAQQNPDFKEENLELVLTLRYLFGANDGSDGCVTADSKKLYFFLRDLYAPIGLRQYLASFMKTLSPLDNKSNYHALEAKIAVYIKAHEIFGLEPLSNAEILRLLISNVVNGPATFGSKSFKKKMRQCKTLNQFYTVGMAEWEICPVADDSLGID